MNHIVEDQRREIAKLREQVRQLMDPIERQAMLSPGPSMMLSTDQSVNVIAAMNDKLRADLAAAEALLLGVLSDRTLPPGIVRRIEEFVGRKEPKA